MGKRHFWTASIIISILFFSCGLIPPESQITVQNDSDFEAENIKLMYWHSGAGAKSIMIESLKAGEKWKRTVEIGNPSLMSYTSRVDIEYYIDGKKYDINNDENALFDDEGFPYNNVCLASGHGVKFIIKNETFISTEYGRK